ncbi:MAG: hypothetical protein ACI89L_002693 [Phycisphaerales bacterium]|jgi:hypothetical protein
MRTMLASVLLAVLAHAAAAQTSTFTYQGALSDAGAPANGVYDFLFRLYDDESPGAPDNQIGVDHYAFSVSVTDGLFTTTLDFGFSAFDGPGLQYLEVAVSPAGTFTFSTLNPRQWVTTAPHALHATYAAILDLPFYGYSTAPPFPGGPIFEIYNGSASGSGIYSSGPNSGMVGWGGPFVSGFPATFTGAGVLGISDTAGINGSSANGYGVVGFSSNGTGGLFDNRNNSASQYALHARSNFGSTAGLFEMNLSTSARPALIATTNSTQSSVYAVHGIIESTSPGGFSTALRGENRGTGGSGIGVYASQAGTGYGVYGTAQGGLGVYGYSNGTGSAGFNAGVRGEGAGGALAGYFSGNVVVTGSLSKGSGTFKIDHPQDPENRFLSHSFVESPEMKNIYDGIVTTDEQGRATVALPSYFDALNTTFRYQLTVIDDSDDFVLAKVTRTIETIAAATHTPSSFAIRTSKPTTRVSWQVTGVRQDAFARAHPVIVEEEKSDADKGRYLHPAAFGRPESDGIGYREPPPQAEPSGG